MSGDLGKAIAVERDRADITQRDLAERLQVHQTAISRLEKGLGTPEGITFTDVLEKIGTDSAFRLRDALLLSWKHLPRPPFDHPHFFDMARFEAALEKLEKVRGNSDRNLVAQATFLWERLNEAASFLSQLDHRIIYIGEIGVGKTTAACRQAGLLIELNGPLDLRGMMLDTGGGRTTLCDVLVQSGTKYSLAVEPLPDDEVYRLAGELCRAIFEKAFPKPDTKTQVEFQPPEEITRALRNMAGMTRPARSRDIDADPLIAMARASRNLETFQNEFASKLTLWRRDRQDIEFDGADELAARQWMRSTFVEINNGRHPEFSLPSKIVVTVPFQLLESPYNVTVIDTRGIDGSAIRPDLIAHLADPRAICLLCCKWGSAPDPSLQSLVTHIIETDINPLLSKRLTVLALARAGDAISMRFDSGDNVETVAEGYDLKRSHIEDALVRSQLPILSSFAFDAAQDDAGQLSAFISQQISTLRNAYIDSARETENAIKEIVENAEKLRAKNILAIVGNQLLAFASEHSSLDGEPVRIYPRLLSAIRGAHPRTLWASTRRKGKYWNFDFYQHLGDGAATLTRRRATKALKALRQIFEIALANNEFASAHSFIKQIADFSLSWEKDLLEAARHHAEVTYAAELTDETELWTRTAGYYGSGINYRDTVADDFEEWFALHEALEAKLEVNLDLAWREAIIEPLIKVAGVGENHSIELKT